MPVFILHWKFFIWHPVTRLLWQLQGGSKNQFVALEILFRSPYIHFSLKMSNNWVIYELIQSELNYIVNTFDSFQFNVTWLFWQLTNSYFKWQIEWHLTVMTAVTCQTTIRRSTVKSSSYKTIFSVQLTWRVL